MNLFNHEPQQQTPWNKDKLTGQKPPLKLKEIWAIRIKLQISLQIRDLALFNLAIDSKLRSCDLVKIRIRDVTHGTSISKRAMVMQQKTCKRHPKPAAICRIVKYWESALVFRKSRLYKSNRIFFTSDRTIDGQTVNESVIKRGVVEEGMTPALI